MHVDDKVVGVAAFEHEAADAVGELLVRHDALVAIERN